MKKIVVIGGGTGTFVVLSALKWYPDVALTAIVSMADDGGSTGALRDQYGVLPPGDVRRALVALSDSGDTLRELFNFRFMSGSLHGHSFGNIFLSALEKMTGNFASALREASRVLNAKGEVIPVTLDNVRLAARLEDGKLIRGETNIDIPLGPHRARIKEIWLEPEARLNPDVRGALRAADLVVIGPGDIYTSIVPNLLVKGMARALKDSKAKKVYIANLMTKFGETDGFRADDFVRVIERYLGKGILHYAFFNTRRPHAKILARYKKEKAEFVEPPKSKRKGKPAYVFADLLEPGQLVRHNAGRKLARAIRSLLYA